MARKSQDRENLLRDAKAFTTRLQLKVSWGENSGEVFFGIRVGEAVSFYFDQDPVYHFNATGKLRRAFVDGYLVKAEAGRLVRLHRQHAANETVMLRDEMTSGEQQFFCASVKQQLGRLLNVIADGQYAIEGQVTTIENQNVVDALKDILKSLSEIGVADSPRVGG